MRGLAWKVQKTLLQCEVQNSLKKKKKKQRKQIHLQCGNDMGCCFHTYRFLDNSLNFYLCIKPEQACFLVLNTWKVIISEITLRKKIYPTSIHYIKIKIAAYQYIPIHTSGLLCTDSLWKCEAISECLILAFRYDSVIY